MIKKHILFFICIWLLSVTTNAQYLNDNQLYFKTGEDGNPGGFMMNETTTVKLGNATYQPTTIDIFSYTGTLRGGIKSKSLQITGSLSVTGDVTLWNYYFGTGGLGDEWATLSYKGMDTPTSYTLAQNSDGSITKFNIIHTGTASRFFINKDTTSVIDIKKRPASNATVGIGPSFVGASNESYWGAGLRIDATYCPVSVGKYEGSGDNGEKLRFNGASLNSHPIWMQKHNYNDPDETELQFALGTASSNRLEIGYYLSDGAFQVEHNIWASGNAYSSDNIIAMNSNIGETNIAWLPSVSFSANGVCSSVSDKRLKTDITSLKRVTAKLLNITGVQFFWKKTPFLHRLYQKKNAGLIAQEVEPHFPETVSIEENGYKTVKYNAFIPILIKAIQENHQAYQQNQHIINELKKRIDLLSKDD